MRQGCACKVFQGGIRFSTNLQYIWDPQFQDKVYEIACFYKKSVCRFVCQCGHFFLELGHYFFLNFGMVLEAYTTLCVTELDFLTKTFFPKNGPNWAKGRVLKLLKNVVISFFCIWSVIKVYTNLYFYTNSAFGKILAPEICAEMLSANQNTE